MNKTSAALAIAFALICEQALAASGVIGGQVSEVVVGSDTRVVIAVEGAYSNPPACRPTDGSTRMEFDLAAPGGKAQLAAFLVALQGGNHVVVVGTGTCGTTYERVAYIDAGR